MAIEVQAASEPQGLSPEILEQLVQGDISKLSAENRVRYYNTLCDRLGIDPAFQPFGYLVLSGKLVLYANKACAEQLRKRHAISITIAGRQEVRDVYTVVAQATLPSGRIDTSTGAVSIGNLKGDALANAIMKTETKAKRRVTLSICGLGMLDETEIETIPGARVVPISEAQTDLIPLQEMPPPLPERKPRDEDADDNRNITVHEGFRRIAKIDPNFPLGDFTAGDLARHSKARGEFYWKHFSRTDLKDFSKAQVQRLLQTLEQRENEALAQQRRTEEQ